MNLGEIDRATRGMVAVMAPIAAVTAWIGIRPVAWFALGGLFTVLVVAMQRVLADARMLMAGGGEVAEMTGQILSGGRLETGAYCLVAGILMVGVAACMRPSVSRQGAREVDHP